MGKLVYDHIVDPGLRFLRQPEIEASTPGGRRTASPTCTHQADRNLWRADAHARTVKGNARPKVFRQRLPEGLFNQRAARCFACAAGTA